MATPTPFTRTVQFDSFVVDLHTGELRRNGVRIKLQGQAFQVLALLLERQGELVTREELREKLWPTDTFVDFEHGLNSAINRLRERLGDSAEAPRFIETLPRRGYRFVAPLARLEEARAQSQPSAEDSLAPGKARRRAIRLVSLTLGIVLAVSYLAWRGTGPVSQAKGPPALVILPFQNLGGDPEQDYFSDGLTEEMITQFGRLLSNHLVIIGRGSAFQYKGTRKSPAQLGEELGVAYVVQGTVRKQDSHVRISAHLVRAKDESQLWADSYDGELTNILALQAEVASAIASSIKIRLTPEDRARLESAELVDPQAYQMYLKGRYHWNQWPQGLPQAVSFFRQAIELDPNYAPAYASLAFCYSSLGFMRPPKTVFPKAREAALKALELDETLAEAHAAMGEISLGFDWNWAETERSWRRALKLNPNSVDGHRLAGSYWIMQGRFEHGIAEARRARDLDPLSPLVSGELAWGYMRARRYDDAVAQYKKTLKLDPSHRLAQAQLGWVLTLQGKYAEALVEFEKLELGGPDPWLAYLYAVSGRRSEALRMAQNLTELSELHYVDPYKLATVYAGLGDKARALAWLEKGFEEHSAFMSQLKVDAFFDSLQSDPRFQNLLRRMNFPR